MNYIYLFVIVGFMFSSCGEDTTSSVPNKSKNGIIVNITNPAGDRWSKGDDYLPLPVNVGEYKEEEVFVISDRIKAGKNVDVLPIGAIRLTQNDSIYTYILSIPSDKAKQSISVRNFDEFSTVYSSVKWILEQYLLNRSGARNIRVQGWYNEEYGLNYLQKEG